MINSGYGKTTKHTLAHRAVWELVNGLIPRDVMVLHQCDNKLCINPGHLFLGSQLDNMRDMCYKKRDKNGKKTHCLSGHPFSAENTYDNGKRRQCRICLRAGWHRWSERQRMLNGERVVDKPPKM